MSPENAGGVPARTPRSVPDAEQRTDARIVARGPTSQQEQVAKMRAFLNARNHTQPLLVPACSAAIITGVAESTWWKLHSAGSTPAPIHLGRATRWNREELRAWIEAGAPSRDRWEAIKQSRHGSGRAPRSEVR